jgi:nitrite reductase (NADH) large subunit
MTSESSAVWVCSVCGYVHRGSKPSEVCPVCGSPPDLFERQKVPVATPAALGPVQWRCLNCEHIHHGATPPETCPVCGAPADRFEAYTPEPVAASSGGRRLKLVIVGAGIAGVSAAEACRETSPDSEILLLSKEDELPYYRLNLTRYLAGEIPSDQLALKPATWFDDNRIEFLRGVELGGLDPAAKEVRLRDGSRRPFDRLILTAGSHPFVPPLPGASRENVTVLRTRTDADRLLTLAAGGAHCVCIGGGLLGLETAGALSRQGASVTLLEGHGWLMPRQLNERAGRWLEGRLGGAGITLRKHAVTRELVGDEQVRGVLLEDGVTLPADAVVLATGVRPNSYLARQAGLHVNQGILVDDNLRTSHPDVYAAGDICEHRGVCYGTWGPAQFQGAIAGLNAADGAAEFAGIPRSNMLKVLGIDLFSVGRVMPEDASYELIDTETDGNYFAFMFRDSHLVGSILLGDTRLSSAVKSGIEHRRDCSDLLRTHPDARQVLDWLAG